jgi:hypothetical protein
MIISIINHTDGKIKDEELLHAIRAINRQILEDFEPYWSMGAVLRLEGHSKSRINSDNPVDMRGDAIIYLQNSAKQKDLKDTLGYHDLNYRGIPFGVVFTDLSDELQEPWSVTLSHEALELLADPEINLMVAGPHPTDKRREVFHWYEMCDAVQDEYYLIDGIQVSNFVLPLYFTGGDEVGGRNDFLGNLEQNRSLTSFGVNRGGYIGYYDPKDRKHHTFAMKDDQRADERMRIKNKAKLTRRSNRYKRNHAKGRQY